MNHSEHDYHGHGPAIAAKTGNGVKDPVCGMTVDPHTTLHQYTHQSRPYRRLAERISKQLEMQ